MEQYQNGIRQVRSQNGPESGGPDSRAQKKTLPLDPYQDESKIEHSQTVGGDGPVVLQDTVLHETLETFVHSKTLERVVHTKGFGAFGYFETYRSMKEYTMLNFLQKPNTKTETATRFSLAVSTKGTADTLRNVRGFSTKFYTPDGVFDLLCNHIPVFLVRDAMRFPESIKSFLPSPKNNLGDPTRFWDFIARAPESTHFVTWLYSDVGTIKSLRKIRAYGVNTYVWKNAQGKRYWVKYHWIPLAGEESITKEESVRLAGINPDICGQDLYDTIQAGTPVEYELCVQIMDPENAVALLFNPLDDTKTWNEKQFPLIPVGKLVLNKNPDDFGEQIEKLAFSPANLLPGVEFSNDKMLQGRSTIYWDAQRYRLGPDFRKIPVNKEKNFSPEGLESSGLGQREAGPQVRIEYSKEDNFAQAGERYLSLSKEEKAHLIDNIASELYNMPLETQEIILGYFYEAAVDMAEQVKQKMAVYSNQNK